VRIGSVIGTVTLKRVHPSMAGSRWIIVQPMSLSALKQSVASGTPAGDGEDLVVYDSLGSGIGQMVAFSEGGEAAAPFHPEKRPVDAYCGILLDKVVLED